MTCHRLIIVAALGAAAMLAAATVRAEAAAEPAVAQATPSTFPITRMVRYTFTLHNPAAQALEHPVLSVYAPVKATSTQRVDRVVSSLPAQATVDPWGNQALRVEVGSLPPYATRILTIDAELHLSDTPRPLPASAAELRVFTRPERFVESDHPQLQEIARSLRGTSTSETARRTYHFVRQSLARTGFTPEDRGALRALADKAGDCTEHAYLLAALLRANAIPARVLAGYLMAESGLLKAEDFHNWTEYYADGAWQLADAHQGNFGRNASRYVATRILSASVERPAAAHRYSAAGSGLRVTMN